MILVARGYSNFRRITFPAASATWARARARAYARFARINRISRRISSNADIRDFSPSALIVVYTSHVYPIPDKTIGRACDRATRHVVTPAPTKLRFYPAGYLYARKLFAIYVRGADWRASERARVSRIFYRGGRERSTRGVIEACSSPSGSARGNERRSGARRVFLGSRNRARARALWSADRYRGGRAGKRSKARVEGRNVAPPPVIGAIIRYKRWPWR